MTELLVVFADLDAQKLVSRLIDRGMERGCLRSFAWQGVRDPMCDARVAQQPLVSAGPYLGLPNLRFVFLWDHHGSGRDDAPPAAAEHHVVEEFQRAGIAAERVEAIAFEPELEVVLEPVWTRVLEELAKRRSELALATPFGRRDPRASLLEAARSHRLRVDSALFEDLGDTLSIPALKRGDAMRRLGERLVEWFGAPTAGTDVPG